MKLLKVFDPGSTQIAEMIYGKDSNHKLEAERATLPCR
jgi:hypothetical protein